ncbi:MAG: FAD-dependent oxidoreductase [Desulfatibacillaceae bacterium]
MLSAILFMVGLGGACGVLLGVASRVFYVKEDPRIARVEDCFAGANCGGCGYAGCSAAAVAVVAGEASPSVCIVGGTEAANAVAAIMGMEVGGAEAPTSSNPCVGGLRADEKYEYMGAMSCKAASELYGGRLSCDIGCLGYGDCVRSCLFDALEIGEDGLPVVDNEKCVGCGACERACPKGLMTVSTPTERLLHFNREDECLAPCRQTCPAQINIPLYIHQIVKGDYEGAVHTIRERNPLLLACGRVCPHPCEENCRRSLGDEPVSINQLKRFVADYEMNTGRRLPVSKAPDTGKKVAIVGGGPAGLTAAFFLRRLGHSPTIFEAMPKLGGMLRYGIPEYRLPKAVLDWEIEGITNLGIDVHTNVAFGIDFDMSSLVAAGYDAIFMGIGAWQDSTLRAEGEDQNGCYTGIDFLARISNGEDIPIGRKAIIIGGGNTAIDCVRTLLRKGCEEVHLVYRRTRKEMPANQVEIVAAEHEGVKFTFLASPLRVVGDENGVVTGLEIQKMELGEPDSSGRRRPVPIEGATEIMDTDMVITAIGQKPDIAFMEGAQKRLAQLKTTRWNTIEVDEDTMQSTIPYVFSAGDSATGPSLVVEAIGGGRRAARSIHQFLTGQPVEVPEGELRARNYVPGSLFDSIEGVMQKPRAEMPELSMEERMGSFVEVDLVLPEEEALREADRCLYCGRTCYTMEILPSVAASAGHGAEQEVPAKAN